MGTVIPPDSRRPFTPKAVDTVKECEVWRREVIYDISEKIEQIADPNLNDFVTRELNDQINKLLGEKRLWELRIKELGGPDYIVMGINIATA
jgi:pre-mRNA-splicing factor ISY1